MGRAARFSRRCRAVADESSGEVISTLFDRLYPVFQDLPRGPRAGQVIVAAGDALMLFDTAAVRFDRPGIVALGAYATPEAASKHGVFCSRARPPGRGFSCKSRRLPTSSATGRSTPAARRSSISP